MNINGVILLLSLASLAHCATLPILGPELSAFTPSFTMPPISVSEDVPTLSAANNQLMYLNWNSSLPELEFALTILRRNVSGIYDKFVFWQENSTQFLVNNWIAPTYISWDTDGDNWVSVVSSLGTNSFSTFMVFKVSDNGTISNIQFPDRKGREVSSSRFLSDGSLVCVSTYGAAPYTSDAGLMTFKVVNDTWTLVDNFFTGNTIQTTGAYLDRVLERTHPIFVLTDTHFIASDNNYMFIYTRLTNGSWALDSSFKARTGKATSISWNGDDAILTGMAFSNQFVLYQKLSNGTWDGSVIVTPSDAGYTNTTQFGMSTVNVNKDTFLVIAPLAQDAASDIKGRVLIVQRRQSQWYLAGQLVADLPMPITFARYNFVVTDKEVLYSSHSGLNSVPLCVFEPTEYTCSDQISLDTCDFGDFNALSLVCNSTIPDCKVPNVASTSVRRINFENNVVTIDYTLSPFMATPQNGTVRITCGGSTGNGPSSAGSPSVTPSTTGIPITSPSTAPNRPSNVTSGSSRTIASLLFVIVVSIASLF